VPKLITGASTQLADQLWAMWSRRCTPLYDIWARRQHPSPMNRLLRGVGFGWRRCSARRRDSDQLRLGERLSGSPTGRVRVAQPCSISTSSIATRLAGSRARPSGVRAPASAGSARSASACTTREGEGPVTRRVQRQPFDLLGQRSTRGRLSAVARCPFCPSSSSRMVCRAGLADQAGEEASNGSHTLRPR